MNRFATIIPRSLISKIPIIQIAHDNDLNLSIDTISFGFVTLIKQLARKYDKPLINTH